MRLHNPLFPWMLALAGLSAALPTRAADPIGEAARGAGKAAMCIGCHGIAGYQATFPELYKVPMISGQGAGYIVAALTEYQSGSRRHPTMRAIAGSLTAQDIADLAAFYARQGQGAAAPAALAAPLPAALKDRMAACVACHGANFSAPIAPAYPRLAGQHADYLYAALKAYATDGNALIGRDNALMRAQVAPQADGKRKPTFSPAELKQVAAYLAALPGELRVVPEPGLR